MSDVRGLLRSCALGCFAAILVVVPDTALAKGKQGQFQICVDEAILLPAKMDGKSWDLGGKSADPAALNQLVGIAAAASGGSTIALNAGFKLLAGATSGPDPYVKVYLDNRLVIRTNVSRDSAQAQWGPQATPGECYENGPQQDALCNNCSKWLPESELDAQVRIEVLESDMSNDDPVGQTIAPRDVLRKMVEDGQYHFRRFEQILSMDISMVSRGIHSVEDGNASANKQAIPPALLNPAAAAIIAPKAYSVVLKTTKGDIVIDVNREWAKKGADRFYSLVKLGFFDDNAFFHVIPGFMAQSGISGQPLVNASAFG